MVRQRNCWDCKKQLTGKYYLFTGNFPFAGEGASRANYCSFCCDKWKKHPRVKDSHIKNGWTKIIEKEVGDKTEDEISEFEDKWERHYKLGISKKNFPDNKTLLNSIQKARQELEPYLQKPEIVEKAWGKGYEETNLLSMSFIYHFIKDDAREKDYKQKVVQPTVEKILGGKLDEEIHTELEGHIPGFSAGRAEGDFKVNGKSVGKYWWVDGDEGDYRRLMIIFLDNNKLALQAFFLKEEELKKELPENSDKFPQTSPKPTNQPDPVKSTNRILIISLIIGGALLVLGIVIFLIKTKKSD